MAAAYALLRDPEQRARFDRGEIDATGAERPEHASIVTSPMPMDGTAIMAARDLRTSMICRMSLLISWGGAPPGGRLRRRQDLRFRLEVPFLDAVRGSTTRVTLPDGQMLDVTIPEGTADGQRLRLKGKGRPGRGAGQRPVTR